MDLSSTIREEDAPALLITKEASQSMVARLNFSDCDLSLNIKHFVFLVLRDGMDGSRNGIEEDTHHSRLVGFDVSHLIESHESAFGRHFEKVDLTLIESYQQCGGSAIPIEADGLGGVGFVPHALILELVLIAHLHPAL